MQLDTRIDESNVKSAKGTVLPTSSLSDPHVRKIIDHIHKTAKVPVKDIEEQIQEEIDRLAKQAQKSPILFSSMLANAVEAALFRMFEPEELQDQQHQMENEARVKAGKKPLITGVKPHSTAPEFNNVDFAALVRRIRVENPTLFPLRNFYNKKPIAAPRIILVPSKDPQTQKEFGSINTAAATRDGEFIFNTHFMQQCMNYSHAKGIKPKMKKYKSNGGTFPDEYAMLEFLILHEFYHYSQADFHYHKVLKDDEGKKAKGKIINWVGDFRTNFDLVKAGHVPIPVGLYNDEINYDRQYTYAEMYNLVKNELKKLREQKKPEVGDIILNRKTNTHHVITAISPDGKKVTTRKATPQEIASVKTPKLPGATKP